MMRLLQWLIFGHAHHWITKAEGTWRNPGDTIPRGMWWDQECTKCGTRRYYQQ